MTVILRWRLALLLFSGCCGAPSQTPSQNAAPLGSVVESQAACPAGPIAGTTCQQLQVICPELRPLPVQIRITEPAAGVPFRGTVVMGSGGNGAGFYAGPEGGRILVGEIAAMGFRVVDKSWEGGTNTFEGGLKKQSCHYAGLLTWIHDHIHKQGKFVATGNSGGSADIGYALTTWGRGDILDVAILTSGPPLSRLDYACVKQASPEWASLCTSIVPKGVMECTPACILGPPRSPVDSFVYKSGVCRQVSPDETPQQLLDDSVVHPGAVLDYPKTKVYFLYGARDCGEPVPIGLTYATKVTSQKSIQFVPRTPHALFSTPEGRQAIKRAIEQGTGGASASLR
jgi:hypothetical protein